MNEGNLYFETPEEKKGVVAFLNNCFGIKARFKVTDDYIFLIQDCIFPEHLERITNQCFGNLAFEI